MDKLGRFGSKQREGPVIISIKVIVRIWLIAMAQLVKLATRYRKVLGSNPEQDMILNVVNLNLTKRITTYNSL
jgi:hypothetical protein